MQPPCHHAASLEPCQHDLLNDSSPHRARHFAVLPTDAMSDRKNTLIARKILEMVQACMHRQGCRDAAAEIIKSTSKTELRKAVRHELRQHSPRGLSGSLEGH